MEFQSSKHCPYCADDTKVIDTRSTLCGIIRRRRVCKSCSYEFETYEITEEDLVDIIPDEVEKFKAIDWLGG